MEVKQNFHYFSGVMFTPQIAQAEKPDNIVSLSRNENRKHRCWKFILR